MTLNEVVLVHLRVENYRCQLSSNGKTWGTAVPRSYREYGQRLEVTTPP
ncbi:MAG TPA: hypothetical protein GXX47_08285 [Firmicutes bacterium]|nr:hypothetical protein [Bacillota bacterium]